MKISLISHGGKWYVLLSSLELPLFSHISPWFIDRTYSNSMESKLQVFHQIDAIRSGRAARVGLYRWQRAAQSLAIHRSASDTGGRHLRAKQLRKALCTWANVASKRVQLLG